MPQLSDKAPPIMANVLNCPNCGGDHWGHSECPFISAPCVICGEATIFACSDCAIDSDGKKSVHVCGKRECREQHDKVCSGTIYQLVK
jgi:hypothetical protein